MGEPTQEMIEEAEDQRVDVFASLMTSEADLKLAQHVYFAARAKEEVVQQILEAQIENRDLWANLGLAIENHGQKLNQIYYNVEKAQAYVKEGNQELADVSSGTSSKNKCRCFILLG